eukprot:7615206-Lingulodinium_polyedra.AAC.1
MGSPTTLCSWLGRASAEGLAAPPALRRLASGSRRKRLRTCAGRSAALRSLWRCLVQAQLCLRLARPALLLL